MLGLGRAVAAVDGNAHGQREVSLSASDLLEKKIDVLKINFSRLENLLIRVLFWPPTFLL
jgi:hypothetical protein